MKNKSNLFFQYSTDRFLEVLDAYQNVLCDESFKSISQIEMGDCNFIDINQPTRKELVKTDDKNLINLLKYGKAYIDTPPLIHPVFVKEVAEILKLTVSELLSLANYKVALIDDEIIKRNIYDDLLNTGPYFIKSLLESKENTFHKSGRVIDYSQLVITKIPLLPIDKRLFICDSFTHSIPGVDNLDYQLIFNISKELLENETNKNSFFVNAHTFLQHYFEELIVSVSDDLKCYRWDTLKQVKKIRNKTDVKNVLEEKTTQVFNLSDNTLYVPLYREHCLEEEPNTPIAISYLGNSRVCIQFSKEVVFYDTLNQKAEKKINVKCFKLHDVNDQKKIMQFYGCQDDEHHQFSDFIHYDLTSEVWFTGMIEGFNYIELSHLIEQKKLIDYQNNIDIILHELASYPTKKIDSACKKYTWIVDKYNNGGLYNLKFGLCVVITDDLYEFLDAEVPVLKPNKVFLNVNNEIKEKIFQTQKNNQFELGALVVKDDVWLLLKDNVLYNKHKPILEIDFPYTCAAFNKVASKLFLCNPIGMLIIETEDSFLEKELIYRYINFSE